MNQQTARLYSCPVCDTVVEVLDRVGSDLVCCGPAMIPLEPKTGETGAKNHLPVIRRSEQGLTVGVGAGRHPMSEDHHIEWIEVAFGNKCFREFLTPGQKPKVTFEIDPHHIKLALRAYCNVHGLWESLAKIGSQSLGFHTARGARTGTGRYPPAKRSSQPFGSGTGFVCA